MIIAKEADSELVQRLVATQPKALTIETIEGVFNLWLWLDVAVSVFKKQQRNCKVVLFRVDSHFAHGLSKPRIRGQAKASTRIRD